jgi:hypothetical protein
MTMHAPQIRNEVHAELQLPMSIAARIGNDGFDLSGGRLLAGHSGPGRRRENSEQKLWSLSVW